jgi:hypothetical protein
MIADEANRATADPLRESMERWGPSWLRRYLRGRPVWTGPKHVCGPPRGGDITGCVMA